MDIKRIGKVRFLIGKSLQKGGILLRLTSKHRTALRLLFEGYYTKDEVAKLVKVSRQTIYNWLHDADFKAALKELEDDFDRKTRSRIRALVRGALERQEKILIKSRNDNAAAIVAKDVLDRAGFMPDNNVNVSGDMDFNVKVDYGDND